MRSLLAVGCILVLADTSKSWAREAPHGDRQAAASASSVRTLLREASDLALRQGQDEHWWCDGVLLQVCELQSRAGDFDGALRSIRACGYPFGRNTGLANLA